MYGAGLDLVVNAAPCEVSGNILQQSQANPYVFAVIRGMAGAVRDQLTKSFCSFFSAIQVAGSAVTWGNPRHGVDNGALQHQLPNIQHMHGFGRVLFFSPA